MKAREVRVALDVAEFSKLVGGEVVEQEADLTMGGVVISQVSPLTVRLILKDIGWPQMMKTIGEAMKVYEGPRQERR